MTGSDLIQGSFYGYNGESYDPITKLQFLRARYYDPDQGRFTAKDTWAGILTSPITQNPYIYANSDPVNYSDPSGHFSLWNAITSGVSKAVNAVKSAATAAYNTVIKPVVTAVYNTVVKPIQTFVGNFNRQVARPAARWTQEHIVRPTQNRLSQATTTLYETVEGASYAAQQTWQAFKAEAQVHTQALVSKANQFVCTTAERIKGGAGKANAKVRSGIVHINFTGETEEPESESEIEDEDGDEDGFLDYLKRSGNQVLMGNYTEDVTIFSVRQDKSVSGLWDLICPAIYGIYQRIL